MQPTNAAKQSKKKALESIHKKLIDKGVNAVLNDDEGCVDVYQEERVVEKHFPIRVEDSIGRRGRFVYVGDGNGNYVYDVVDYTKKNYSDSKHPIYDVSKTRTSSSQAIDPNLEELDLDSSAKDIRQSVYRYLRSHIENAVDKLMDNEFNCWKVQRAVPEYDANWCADEISAKLLQDLESGIDSLVEVCTQLLMKNKGKGWF